MLLVQTNIRHYYVHCDGSRKITKHRYMHISTKTYIMHHIMFTSKLQCMFVCKLACWELLRTLAFLYPPVNMIHLPIHNMGTKSNLFYLHVLVPTNHARLTYCVVDPLSQFPYHVNLLLRKIYMHWHTHTHTRGYVWWSYLYIGLLLVRALSKFGWNLSAGGIK